MSIQNSNLTTSNLITPTEKASNFLKKEEPGCYKEAIKNLIKNKNDDLDKIELIKRKLALVEDSTSANEEIISSIFKQIYQLVNEIETDSSYHYQGLKLIKKAEGVNYEDIDEVIYYFRLLKIIWNFDKNPNNSLEIIYFQSESDKQWKHKKLSQEQIRNFGKNFTNVIKEDVITSKLGIKIANSAHFNIQSNQSVQRTSFANQCEKSIQKTPIHSDYSNYSRNKKKRQLNSETFSSSVLGTSHSHTQTEFKQELEVDFIHSDCLENDELLSHRLENNLTNFSVRKLLIFDKELNNKTVSLILHYALKNFKEKGENLEIFFNKKNFDVFYSHVQAYNCYLLNNQMGNAPIKLISHSIGNNEFIYVIYIE